MEKQDNPKYLHSEITGKILQGFYTVCNKFYYGLPEEILCRAMVVELESIGLKCKANKAIKVNYKNVEIGEYRVNILVENKVIVKIISTEKITGEDEILLTNQLRMSEIEVGLLLNFSIEAEHKRKVFTNDLKK